MNIASAALCVNSGWWHVGLGYLSQRSQVLWEIFALRTWSRSRYLHRRIWFGIASLISLGLVLKSADFSDHALWILFRHLVAWTFHRYFEQLTHELNSRLGLGNVAHGCRTHGFKCRSRNTFSSWDLCHSLYNTSTCLSDPFRWAWSALPFPLRGGLSVLRGQPRQDNIHI